MRVVIAKVNEVLYEGEAHSLSVPGAEGVMTVLARHEPFITTLKAGRVGVRAAAGEAMQEFEVDGGILEVHASGATVIL